MFQRLAHTASHILLTIAALIAYSCAKQGYPEGGPRDTTPPKMVKEYPASGSRNISTHNIFVEFDEYVVVKDPDNNIVVSPPMSPKPTYTPKGHGISISLPDTLQPDATYQLQFMNAIADFTEGNAIENYTYAFATGSNIDTLTLSGFAMDAQTLKPHEKEVTVMFYAEPCNDSVVVKRKPDYLTKAHKDGSYTCSFMRPGFYRIVALIDENRDLLLDPTETMAFSSCGYPAHPADTTATPNAEVLLLSIDEQQAQRIAKSEFTAPGCIEIVSVAPLQNPIILSDSDFVYRINPSADTIRAWTSNPKCTKIQITLHDDSGIDDTLKLQWRERRKSHSASSKTAQKNNDWISWSASSPIPYFAKPSLRCSIPLDTTRCVLDSAVRITNLADSSANYYAVEVDSSLMNVTVPFTPQSGEKYQMVLLPGRLINIFGQSTDSIAIATETEGADKYGSVFITVHGDSTVRYVIQLTDASGKTIQSKIAQHNDKVSFIHLHPATYKIQAFADLDLNGKWTPGNYWLHRQPEPYHFMEKEIPLRANWDIEEIFEITR
ncbi:MAG: Ig-like domain-containing protein [Bacteroidales bacterium]|nr:Ig-like domain-containing protein [Candidatus Colimorpha onthohippi]